MTFYWASAFFHDKVVVLISEPNNFDNIWACTSTSLLGFFSWWNDEIVWMLLVLVHTKYGS